MLLPSLTFVQSADGKLIPTLAPSQSQDGLNPLLVNASSSSSSTAAGVSPHSLSGIDPAQLQQLQLQQQQSQQQHPGVAGAELTTGGIVPSHFLASTPDGQRILVRADALTGAAAGDATTATLSAPNRVIPNHHLPEQQQPVLTYSDKERVALESLQLSHQESMPQLRAPDASAAVVDARMMAVVAVMRLVPTLRPRRLSQRRTGSTATLTPPAFTLIILCHPLPFLPAPSPPLRRSRRWQKTWLSSTLNSANSPRLASTRFGCLTPKMAQRPTGNSSTHNPKASFSSIKNSWKKSCTPSSSSPRAFQVADEWLVDRVNY